MELREHYIDIEDALQRIGGNMDLYVRLLTKFTDSDNITSLENAINTGTIEDATQKAHTLKGTAANLSLKRIAEVALELEQKLKSDLDFTDSFITLKQVYNKTIDYINEGIE